jgi:hypothetical protein
MDHTENTIPLLLHAQPLEWTEQKTPLSNQSIGALATA